MQKHSTTFVVSTLCICSQLFSLLSPDFRGGTFFLGGGGGRAGASEVRVISESEHQKGRAIPHVRYSREGHTSFPEFFSENFCDVAFHFSYRLSFSFHLF